MDEVQFLIQTSTTSAADAITALSGAVPEKKVWSILQAAYYPSVAETRNVYLAIYTAAGFTFPVTLPGSIALSPSIVYPALREGMELRMFPGDRLMALRDVATAGSSMTLRLRFVETDMPLYEFIEPQEERRIRRSAREALRAISGRMRGAPGGGGDAGGVMGFPVGGGGRGLEK